MELTISSVDHAPEDLYDQAPLRVELMRQIPGPDRPDYWLGSLVEPVSWLGGPDGLHEVSHVVLAARWQGTSIGPGSTHLPVGIAYVTDTSVLEDEALDFAKCRYVAIGIADDSTDGRPVAPLTSILSGHIARLFGTGFIS